MKIHPTSEGEIIYKGQKVNKKLSKDEVRDYREKVQMIFQDPMASLNERAKVDYIVSEGLYNFKLFRELQVFGLQEEINTILIKHLSEGMEQIQKF